MATPEDIKIRLTAQDSASRVIRQAGNEMRALSRTATTTGAATTRVSGGLTTVGRSAGQAGIQIQQLIGQIQGGTNPMLALSQQSADLGFVLGAPLVGAVVALGASLAMSLIPQLFETTKSTADLVKEIDELRARTGELTDAQKALIQQDIAKQITAQRQEVDRLTKSIEANQRAASALRQAQQDAFEDPEAVGIVDYESQLEEVYQRRITLSGELANAESKLRLLEEGRSVEGDKFVLSLRDQAAMLGKTRTETIAYQAAQLDLSDSQKKLVESYIRDIEVYDRAQEALKKNSSELEKLGQITKFTEEQMDKAAAGGLKSMEDGLVGFITGTKSVSQSFKSMADSIIADLIRIQIRQSITAPLANMISGGNLLSGIGDFFGGFFANGGRPPMNKVSVVGERGPELFVPDSAGTVVPAGASMAAASQPVHITYNIQSWDSRDTMDAIQKSAPQIVGIVQNAFNKRGRRGPMG